MEQGGSLGLTDYRCDPSTEPPALFVCALDQLSLVDQGKPVIACYARNVVLHSEPGYAALAMTANQPGC